MTARPVQCCHQGAVPRRVGPDPAAVVDGSAVGAWRRLCVHEYGVRCARETACAPMTDKQAGPGGVGAKCVSDHPGCMSGPNRLPGITFDKTLYLDYAQVGALPQTASARPPRKRAPTNGRTCARVHAATALGAWAPGRLASQLPGHVLFGSLDGRQGTAVCAAVLGPRNAPERPETLPLSGSPGWL